MKVSWFILLVLFFVSCQILTAQESFNKKNGLSIHYSPCLSIGDFSNAVISLPGGFDEARLTGTGWLPLPASQIGFGYTRRIATKYFVALNFQRGSYGVRSNYGYNYLGLIPSDTSEYSGGLSYNIRVIHTSMLSEFGFYFKQIEKYASGLSILLGVSVYETFVAQINSVEVKNGFQSFGYYSAQSYNYKGEYFPYLLERIRLKQFRPIISLKMINSFKLYKNFFFEANPEFQLFLQGFERDYLSDVQNNQVVTLGLQLKLSYYL